MSRAQLTSTVEQNTGGAVSPYVAGKNKIINGDFAIAQRGASFSAQGYTADRWTTGYINGSITFTWSQIAFDYGSSPASDKLPITGQIGTYFARSSIASASATFAEMFVQKIEDVHTFANQTITISFWAKSDISRTQTLELFQNFGSGGSSSSGGTVSTFNTTTAWQRFTFTTTPASITGKTIGAGSFLGLYIAQAVASGSILDVWGVQVEAGSVATPFTTATGTLSGELTACQRYYQRWTATAANAPIVNGCYYSSVFHAIYPFKVTMRTTPSMNASSYSQWYINAGTTYYSPSASLGFGVITPDTTEFYVATTSSPSGGTAGYLYAGLNSYVEMSAEL